MKNRWIGAARVAIVLSAMVLFINCLALFIGIKRDMSYGSRAVGLSAMNDYFDSGDYNHLYRSAVANEYADDELFADVSQYKAFGRYYRAYVLARIHDDNEKYLKDMEEEKAHITWKKILFVTERLEKELNDL